jgi:hypothetical protein
VPSPATLTKPTSEQRGLGCRRQFAPPHGTSFREVEWRTESRRGEGRLRRGTDQRAAAGSRADWLETPAKATGTAPHGHSARTAQHGHSTHRTRTAQHRQSPAITQCCHAWPRLSCARCVFRRCQAPENGAVFQRVPACTPTVQVPSTFPPP